MSGATAWNQKKVAHAWKIRYPHISSRDTLLWVNKRGILFRWKTFCIFKKILKNCNSRKMPKINAASTDTKTLLLDITEGSRIFWNLYSCVGDIRKWFKSKNRIIKLILNSQWIFENCQNLISYKFHFGAVFQETFFLCGITQNRSRLRI